MKIKVQFTDANDKLKAMWVDIDDNTTESDVNDAIDADEFLIVELEDFDGLKLPVEFDIIEAYAKNAETYGSDTVEAAIEIFGQHHFEGALDNGDYQGNFDSEEEFARHIVAELGELDESSHLAQYFDYAAYGRDLFLQDFTMADNGDVFRNS